MSLLPSSNPKGYARIFALFIFFLTVISLLNVPFFNVENTSAASPFVTRSGSKLFLNDQQYQFTGLNAFNLATFPGYNAGCGGYVADLDAFFSKLRPNSAVRMWAFQGTAATHTTTKKIDWTGLDRVVNAAQKNGKKVILVLGNQDGHCDDGHYKDKSWYSGGYKQSFNDIGNGLTPLPYLDYVKAVVSRYKDVPAIAMWEPINEPAAGECVSGKGYECYSNLKCSDEPAAAAALKSFFDNVGATIKSIDSNHLISSGTLGNGQCGTVYEDYQLVHSSSGIDVASYHDYDDVDKTIPGDQWNGLQKRISQMKILNKPLYIGEVGMIGGSGNCMSLASRRDKMKAKMDAQFASGITGFTPWSLTLSNASGCNYDIVANDPLLTLLHDYPVSMSTSNPAPLNTPFPMPSPTPDTQIPTVATNLKVGNISPTQVSFSWTAATDNIGVDRYEVYRDYSYITSVWTTSFTDSNVTPGKSYVYYLKTRDGSGNSSGTSALLNVTIPSSNPTPTPTPKPSTPTTDTQAPTAPTGITGSNVASNKLTLNWTGATDNTGINRYEIYKDWSYIGISYSNNFDATGLIPGKSYLFYLKTRDGAGNSSGESVKFTITMPSKDSTTSPDTLSPTAPAVILPGNLTPTSVTLTWSGATDNASVNRYEIYKDWQYVTASFTNSQTITGLTPGKTYLFYLKSRDQAGNSSGESIKVTVKTPTT